MGVKPALNLKMHDIYHTQSKNKKILHLIETIHYSRIKP